MRAFGPWVVLRREKPPQQESAIIVPDVAQQQSNVGRVVSVGDKVAGIAVDDLVVYIGLAFEVDGLLVVKADNVLVAL